MTSRRSNRRGAAAGGAAARYPRAVRVNQLLREVIAEALERIADSDDRLALLTVTAVDCDPDFRRARVLLASLGEAEEAALGEMRVRLQAAVSQEVRLKRTPLLSFAADPAVRNGQAIEDILRNLDRPSNLDPSPPEAPDEGS
jgi:ribosome-binding factor A